MIKYANYENFTLTIDDYRLASATVTRDLTIPDEGVVFSSGIYVQYTVATFNTMTVFHA